MPKLRLIAGIAVAIVLSLAGCSSSHGGAAHASAKATASPDVSPSPSASRLALAVPVMAGPQPTQVDPNEILPASPCDALRESGALNLASPLKDNSKLKLKFTRGGQCTYSPNSATHQNPGMFSVLYEGRKGARQVAVNYGDALMYSREHFELKYGSYKRWSLERGGSPATTDQEHTTLVAIKGSEPRRYTDVIVTTSAPPRMTMLIHLADPLNKYEANTLATFAASSAYRVGLRLRAN